MNRGGAASRFSGRPRKPLRGRDGNRLLMNPQDRRQNDNEASEVGETFSLSAVWVGCVPFPLTLALSLRERERASCGFSSRASFSLAPCALRFNAETPARPGAFDSPRRGGRFSLSPRERAGVRGRNPPQPSAVANCRWSRLL